MQNPELSLWRAVVSRAIADAVDEGTTPEKDLDRAEARRWLLAEPNPDRELVCALADVDAGAAVDRALRLKLRGWRLGAVERAALTQAAQGRDGAVVVPALHRHGIGDSLDVLP
jgi:hypothetical protein